MDPMQNATGGTVGNVGSGMLSNQEDDTTAGTAATADDPKQNLNQVINSIQKTLGLLHQLYLTVSSFNTASQLPLLQRLYHSSYSFSPLFFPPLWFLYAELLNVGLVFWCLMCLWRQGIILQK
uniref:Nut2 n=1 Tax=Rhizophora mucronata TaxID=61149 RepID=A0A2P2JRG5_RHIMU